MARNKCGSRKFKQIKNIPSPEQFIDGGTKIFRIDFLISTDFLPP